MIVVIEGLGQPGTGPVLEYIPDLQKIGVAVIPMHWKEVYDGSVNWGFLGKAKRVKLIGYSLGGFAALFVAKLIDSIFPEQIIATYVDLIDPVPGDIEHPWTQLTKNRALLTPNILKCNCYLRDRPGFPFHEPLAFADGLDFNNIWIPNSDHVSVVRKVKDQVIESTKELFQ